MKINNPLAWKVAPKFGIITLNKLKKDYGVRIVSSDAVSIIEYKNVWYSLNDNGGEINLWEINTSQENTVSIPYTIYGKPISAATLAYRINEKLNGKSDREINWDLEL